MRLPRRATRPKAPSAWARRAVEAKADERSCGTGGLMDDRVAALEPLHRGAVRAGEALGAFDDRRGHRFRIELQSRDLLLRLDDRVQPPQARSQAILVAL